MMINIDYSNVNYIPELTSTTTTDAGYTSGMIYVGPTNLITCTSCGGSYDLATNHTCPTTSISAITITLPSIDNNPVFGDIRPIFGLEQRYFFNMKDLI